MKQKQFIFALVAMLLSFVSPAFAQNVAKVGNTEYATIDEAIANWTNNATLTLLADVTLSDVVTLKSTEHHILNLGTYTMTAASGKHAIEITCEGRSSASYALTVNADASNPGGITATGKSCIYYKKSDSTKDRPIILINNGVFTGSYSINSTSNGNTNCPQIWINGGIFNSYMNLTKNMLRISGGTFHAAINATGDSSAYREIKGGRFKSWQFMTADAPTKFWVGSGNGNYNVGVYVDDEGYLCVGGPVITEVSAKYPAVASNYSKWSSYLKYSAAATYGLFYEDVDMAIAKHGAANVTVYEHAEVVEELDNNAAVKDFTPELPSEVVTFEVEAIDIEATAEATTKVTFNVEPKNASGAKVSNPSAEITFRLPVPAAWSGKANVYHEGTLLGAYTIKEESGAKYVEVSSANFSEFAVEAIVPLFAGEGTEASPYIIDSADKLAALRNEVNGGEAYAGVFFKLTSDITLSGEWTAIGNGSRSSKSYTGNAFKGVFDGDNNTISGLTITSTTAADAAIGLFGVVDGGTVKNLNLTNVDINVPSSNLAGAAIGMMLNKATADNITVSGAVVGNDGVGGIVGRVIIDGTIENCINNASVTSSYGGIGGIVGKAYYEDGANTATFATVTGCTNKGTITAPMYVGGIAGLARAKVTNCVNEGAVVGGTQTGGIVGQLMAAGTVSGNENKAKVSGKSHVGGIIGDYSQSSSYTYNNVTIANNVNRGELAATEQCAAILGCNNIDGFTAMTATGNQSFYYVEGLELFGNPEDMVMDATNKFILPTVAIVNGQEFSSFTEALEATKTMTGDVTVEIYDKVTFNQPLIGNYTSINFVGKDTDAEMYLDVQGYTTATGKKVTFTDLKLSKSEGGFIANAGFMNVAFGIYDVEEVTYTNCTFENGACASSGKVTFNGCTFKKSWDKYGLWAYGNVDVTVQGSTFADYRGIKMYAENGADASVEKANLTVKNTNFSAVDNKPAIVLTYGESVVLEGNTYSSTGTFELDLDGKPNGVAVTSDVAPVCVNDNGACGVLVDGKIYTTVTQAAEVATSGSTVTLLHNSAETVALPMGVTLNKNNFEAAGVTVAGPVAKIGDVEYATLAEAIAAAQAGETITLIDNVVLAERITIPADKTLTIDLNGKSISMEESIIATAYAINNLGNLTITDGVGGGSINARGVYNGYGDGGANVATAKITVLSGTINAKGTNGGAAVYNYGIAEIKGGTFTSIGGYSLNSQSGASMTIADGVTANNGIYVSGATLVVDGGEISGNRSGCHVLYAWNSNVTIAGGTFHNNNSGNSTTMAGGTTKLTINGGTFSIANGKSTNGWTSCLIDATDGGKYEINGGEFKGHFRVQANCAMEINGGTFENTHGEAYVNGGTVAVKGGTFTDAAAQKFATDNLAAGYELGANGTVAAMPVAEVNGTKYASFAETAAAAQAGSEIKLLANIEGDITVPANVTLNGNGFAVSGTITADGEITFAGVTKAGNFGVKNVNTVVNIPAGASLQLTGTGRMVIGHGCTFNITGSIADNAAKTTDKATLTPSLVMPGASFTGAGVTFNVTNAYISAPSSYCSSSKSASGTFDFNINNSIWENAGKFAFESQSTAATVNFDLVNSVLNTGSHLVFGVSRGEVVIDNSNVNVGKSNQIENQSTMTIKNGSVVNGAVATSSNAKNPGTIIVENATYAVTGEFSGSDLGTGTLIIKKGANVSVGSIKAGANVTVDAEGMAAGDEINFTANLSQFTGTLSVINNDKLEASIVDGKVVLAAKPVAKIGEQGYATLEAALAAQGNEVELLATYEVAAGETKTLDLKGKTVTMVYTAKATKNHTMVSNSGNLTIESSVEGGKLSYTYAGEDLGVSYSTNTVTSNPGSVLTVKSGTIENLTYDKSVIAYAIDGLTNGGAGDVTVNIEGGVITSKRQAVRIFANSTTNTGALNISGGDITGRVIVQNANANANKAVLNITAGTFNANEYKSDVLYVGGSSSATIDINASVSGGTFNGEITETNVAGFITGGTYKTDVNQFCALGYQAEANAEGLYAVEYTGKVAEFTIVDGEYTEFNIEEDVEVGTLTYTRTIYEGWNALYVPFEIPVNELTNDFEVAYINDMHWVDKNDDFTMQTSEMTMEVIKIKNGTLKANHPYIIRPKNGAEIAMNLELNDVILHKTSEKVDVEFSSAYVEYKVSGTYTKAGVDILNNGNDIYIVSGDNFGVMNNAYPLPAFRIFMTVENKEGSPVIIDQSAPIRIRVAGEKDEATGIITPIIEGDVHVNDGTVYDLMGRPVRTPEKGKIYIMNGKKVLF